MHARRVAIALAAILSASASFGLGPELMVNGSFEQAGGGEGKSPFAGWTAREWDGGAYTFAAAKGRDGATCIVITCVTQGRGGVGQIAGVRLEPGKRYLFSLWVKEENARGDEAFVNFYSPEAGDLSRLILPGGTHDWMRLTWGVSTQKPCSLNVYVHNKTIGSLWLDDASLREIAPGEELPDEPRPEEKPYAHIPPGADYALGVASPLARVFHEAFPDKPADAHRLTVARGESEGFQLVVLHPRRDLTGVKVAASPLTDAQSGAVIPPSAVTISPIGSITVGIRSTRMYIPRLGPWPEVLLPDAPFDVRKNGLKPVFIDVKVAAETPAGTYSGAITVAPANAPPQSLALTVQVRRFALPRGREAHLRTISFMGGGWQSVGGKEEDYEQMALDHRLGVGGFAVSGTSGAGVRNDFRNWSGTGPKHSFAKIEPKLTRLMAGGMNAFMMAVVPNLAREGKDAYPDRYLDTLGEFVRAYHDFAKSKGWGDCAFVYGYDEVPPKHFELAKETYAAVKKACPDARVLLCLNEPEAVAAMAGHTDVYLLYIHNHLKSRVDELKKPNERVWWSYGCIYPAARPNQFLVYPLIDVRVMPWLAERFGVEGLSVWGLTYYASWSKGVTFPAGDWMPKPAAPGDGEMIYPGPEGRPLASMRLKAVRDGLEDREYLALAQERAAKGDAEARKLLAEIHDAFKQPTVYPDDPALLLRWRERLGDLLDSPGAGESIRP
jgi:hypothetical protein